ncbi:peptidoglycan DD-metalloendopeptidase family protein [Niallia sp. 01092]|uniref:peptidoglycan DD-metalloendopeptidase family protein n=1 Tax=unclassified Niallia TaxID=2837522 RepID=UPI003FD44EF7
MSSRIDDIRKRIEKRKREQSRMEKNVDSRIVWTDEDNSSFPRNNEPYDDDRHHVHPLFRKELFLLKILGAAILFLAVAIITKQQSETFAPAENAIRQAMNQEFNFAGVSKWYENQFGKPLAFLPSDMDGKSNNETNHLQQYALSASGKILEDFKENGQRVAIETGSDTTVQAMNEGTVVFAGEKEGFGNTVVIQHSDKSESWYGNLKEIDVKIYDTLKQGDKVGVASSYEHNDSLGLFYFAIKKGNDFIDPIQVIDFE